jgi:hypothetical protein
MCGTINFKYETSSLVFGTFPANANGDAAIIGNIGPGDVSIINDAPPPFDVTYDLITGVFTASSDQVCATAPQLTIQSEIVMFFGTSGSDFPLPSPFLINIEVKITDNSGVVVYTDDVGSVGGDNIGNIVSSGRADGSLLIFDPISTNYGGEGRISFVPTPINDTIPTLPSTTFKMTVSTTSSQISADVGILSEFTAFWKTPNAGAGGNSQSFITAIPLARRELLDCERKIVLGFG